MSTTPADHAAYVRIEAIQLASGRLPNSPMAQVIDAARRIEEYVLGSEDFTRRIDALIEAVYQEPPYDDDHADEHHRWMGSVVEAARHIAGVRVR